MAHHFCPVSQKNDKLRMHASPSVSSLNTSRGDTTLHEHILFAFPVKIVGRVIVISWVFQHVHIGREEDVVVHIDLAFTTIEKPTYNSSHPNASPSSLNEGTFFALLPMDSSQ